MALLRSLQIKLFPLLPMLSTTPSSTKTLPTVTAAAVTRRQATVFGSTLVVASLLNLFNLTSTQPRALSQQLQDDELQQEEDHLVHLFQETSPSVVFLKDLELTKVPKTSSEEVVLDEGEDAKVEGTGSGFIWDKFGHIVSRKANQKGESVRPT